MFPPSASEWPGFRSRRYIRGGPKNKRFALPNAEVMIHQLMGGAEGQATEIEITARHMIKIKDRPNKNSSDATGQPI